MKYKIGDKVKVVSNWRPGCNENPHGETDKWLGTTMTIRDICYEDTSEPCYRMVEDIKDCPLEGGWYWYEPAIARLA